MYIYYKENNNEYINENGKEIDYIGKLGKVNILVGENNAGKSRFIRNLIKKDSECRIFDGTLDETAKNSIENQLKSIVVRIKEKNSKFHNALIKKLDETENIVEKTFIIYNMCSNEININDYSNIINKLKNIITSGYFNSTKICTSNFYYIPILRGMENFEIYFGSKEKLENIQMTIKDMDELNGYINKAKKIYSNKLQAIYNISFSKIFTAEELYDEVVDILLGEEQQRENFHKFEKFIDDNFYNSEGFSINPNRNKNCLMVKIRKEKEYEIYNLGDGIKQLISLLYQIYMHKDEKYIFFIEEPEINLHPGFQRKFMEILLQDEFNKHIYFINTHSNHIIDIINESKNVQLYKFRKKQNKKEIINVNNDYLTILNELGIRSSSIFLSNCTIWVEGISDRIYIKKYLELYFKKQKIENIYKENIHYSFVEYGGINLPHWNFDASNDNLSDINVRWLSHNVFLIVDNDDTASNPTFKKHKRKEDLKNILKDNFFELKSREIENLIPIDILEKTLKKDNKIDSLERIKYNTEQWKNRYKQDLISNPKTHMGTFIDSTYKLVKKYSNTSGTIINKAAFAYKVCNEIETYDDLTIEAKELTEKIANFIVKNN